MTYRRPYIVLTVISIAVLACGAAPALLVEYPTITPTPAATETATSQAVEMRQVLGWWNLRDAPAGNPIGDVMNETVQVLRVSGDWAQTPDGWICRRAFGEQDARCVLD